MLKLKKIVFILLTVLLIPLGALAGGYVGGSGAANDIQSQEGWQPLAKPPVQVVQILGFCQRLLCVKADDGKQYLYNTFGCEQPTDQNCWHEVTMIEIEAPIPEIANPCMYEFQIPGPPADTIQMLGVKTCGSGGDYYESYALLEDGSVWKWDHSINDLAPLSVLPGVIAGALFGLLAGLLAAVVIFWIGWTRINHSSTAGGKHE